MILHRTPALYFDQAKRSRALSSFQVRLNNSRSSPQALSCADFRARSAVASRQTVAKASQDGEQAADSPRSDPASSPRPASTEQRMASVPGPTVRAIYEAFRVPDAPPPYDTGRIKVLYPASGAIDYVTEIEKKDAPYPVVIFLGGAFVEQNRYQWLGEKLVNDAGIVFVTYEYLGVFGERKAIMVESVSKTFVMEGAVLKTVFGVLERLNTSGTLAGALDLNRVVFGGHSAGGSVLLDLVNVERFPAAKGIFAYAAHMAAGPRTGYAPGSIKPAKGTIPTLLMSGTLDGVIKSFGQWYGKELTSGAEPIRRTFEEAFSPDRPAIYVEFDGFNHLVPVDPIDTTLGSGYRDLDAAVDKATMKEEFAKVVSLFVLKHAFEDTTAAEALQEYLNAKNALIKDVKIRS